MNSPGQQAQNATGDQRRNNSRKNEETETKQKQHPVVDVTGDGSKVQCCKEQQCRNPPRVTSLEQKMLPIISLLKKLQGFSGVLCWESGAESNRGIFCYVTFIHLLKCQSHSGKYSVQFKCYFQRPMHLFSPVLRQDIHSSLLSLFSSSFFYCWFSFPHLPPGVQTSGSPSLTCLVQVRRQKQGKREEILAYSGQRRL